MFLQIVRDNGLLLEVWNLFDLLLHDNNNIVNSNNNRSHSTHQRFVNFDDITLLCEVGNFPREQVSKLLFHVPYFFSPPDRPIIFSEPKQRYRIATATRSTGGVK